MEKQLEKKCGYYEVSRNLIEKNIIEIKEAIRRYKDIGCYECSGSNKECPTYFNPQEEYNKGWGRVC